MADCNKYLEDEYCNRGRGNADSESDDGYEAITRPTDTSTT